MFYCDPCAEKYEWPKTIFAKSQGKCEMCDEVAICNDVPSSALSFANWANLIEVKVGHSVQNTEGMIVAHFDQPMKIKNPCGALAPCVLNGHAIASCRLDKGHDQGDDATLHEFVLHW